MSTTLPITRTYSKTSNGYETHFYELEYNPTMVVAVRVFPFDTKTYADVVFYPKDTKSFKALKNTSTLNALAVLNTVKDIVDGYLDELDAVFFTAKSSGDDPSTVEKRLSLYNRISSKYAKQYGLHFKNVTIAGDKVYILSKQEFSDSDIFDFVKYCQNKG